MVKENLLYYKVIGGFNVIRLFLCLFLILFGCGLEEINFCNVEMSVLNLDVFNVFERCVIYYMNESVFGFIWYFGEKRIGGGGRGFFMCG